MDIVFARIDNRLMHGIVISQYLPGTDAQRIMVIDDDVASNQTRKDMMMIAKPNGYAASIITLQKAKENIIAEKYGNQKIFLLAKSPTTILEVMQLGVKIHQLIVGTTDMINEGIRITDRAFVTEKELDDLRKIRDLGCEIIVQHNPSQIPVSLWKIVK